MTFIKTGFILIVGCCFISCSHSPVDFNNKLVTIQKQVFKEVHEFGNKVVLVNVDEIKNPGLLQDAIRIDSLIGVKILVINNMPIPEAGLPFKTAVLDQLIFEKDLINNINKLMGDSATGAEKKEIESMLKNSWNQSVEMEANVSKEQGIFARHHNFKLSP